MKPEKQLYQILVKSITHLEKSYILASNTLSETQWQVYRTNLIHNNKILIKELMDLLDRINQSDKK